MPAEHSGICSVSGTCAAGDNTGGPVRQLLIGVVLVGVQVSWRVELTQSEHLASDL